MEKPETPISVNLKDLVSGSVSFETLEKAFGADSLGIIIVTGLPFAYQLLREKLLGFASYLAQLPKEKLELLTSPHAKHLVGWSHGVETLKPGYFDTYKGSYYVNCSFHADASLEAAPPLPSAPDDFPEYTDPNVWPKDDDLPHFKDTFQALCKLIIDCAELVARACDRYAKAKIDGYQDGYLERTVKESTTSKARLLHYFPPDVSRLSESADETSNSQQNHDDWCATHVDHGCLTGLTSALYVDETSPLPPIGVFSGKDHDFGTAYPVQTMNTLSNPPDSTTGLYIRSRTGKTTKVAIPQDALAFQTGEALERITQGKFRAVPHFVRAGGRNVSAMHGIARNTLAVFTQPNLDSIVDREKGINFAAFSKEVIHRNQ